MNSFQEQIPQKKLFVEDYDAITSSLVLPSDQKWKVFLEKLSIKDDGQ